MLSYTLIKYLLGAVVVGVVEFVVTVDVVEVDEAVVCPVLNDELRVDVVDDVPLSDAAVEFVDVDGGEEVAADLSVYPRIHKKARV